MKFVTFIRTSLYRKLNVSILLSSLLPLLILAFLSYSGYVDRAESRAANYRYELMKLFASNMEQFLTQIEQISYTVYQDNAQQILSNQDEADPVQKVRDAMTLEKMFQKQLNFYHFYALDSILILNRKGDVVYNSDGVIDPAFRFAESEWFRETGADQERADYRVVGPHRQPYFISHSGSNSNGNAKEPYALSYIHQIGNIGAPLKPLGTIIIDFKLQDLGNLMQPLLTDGSGRITIVDDKGTIVYDSDSRRIGTMTDKALVPGFEEEQGYTLMNMEGKKQLVSYFKLASTGWNIYYLDDIQVLVSDTADIRQMTIWLVVVSFVVAVIISIALTVGLLRPMNKLKKMMKQVRDGNLNVHVPMLSHDEINELGLGFNEMLQRVRQLVDEVYKMQIHEREAQLKALQAQINPHFLYNTLETINSIAQVKKVDIISKIARAMSDMFRYSIRMEAASVPLAEEIRHIENYLKIMNIRFDNKIVVVVDIPEELRPCMILKLTLQPVVENALVHGLELKPDQGLLCIRARKCADELEMIVSDNGIGMTAAELNELNRALQAPDMPQNAKQESGGIGMRNVHHRIRYYFGDQYGLAVSSKYGEGTEVRIRLPVLQEASTVFVNKNKST